MSYWVRRLGVLGLLLYCTTAHADVVHWLVTEWGSAYRNFEKVADKKYREPQQIAGTADHYWVVTRGGTIYRDGTSVGDQLYKGLNIVDLDAVGDDYYVLVRQGRLYKNGQVALEDEKLQRATAMAVIGADVWTLIDSVFYKNGVKASGPYNMRGAPSHFAVAGDTVWCDSAGDTGAGGGMYIYKNGQPAHDETWIVRELGVVGGDFYLFSGKSLFRNFERVARFEPEKAATTSHLDNVIDFHFAGQGP